MHHRAKSGQTSIVVVNDSPEFLALIQELLTDERYRVEVCQYGDGAYEVIKRIRPDLAIIDVRLPDVSGWDILQMMRLDPDLAGTPVLVCSAAIPELREMEPRLREVDAEILTKPFAIDALLVKVDRLTGGPRLSQ